MINFIKYFSSENNIVTTGLKVRHQSGGPEMTLIGFLHPVADIILFKKIGDNLTKKQQIWVAEKIILHTEKGFGFFPAIASKTFYGHIWNSNGRLENWCKEGEYAPSVKCICRYYSDLKGDFKIEVFTPTELEIFDN